MMAGARPGVQMPAIDAGLEAWLCALVLAAIAGFVLTLWIFGRRR